MVERCEPILLFLEESDGLRTHHRSLYDEVHAELESWGYEWRRSRAFSREAGEMVPIQSKQ